MFNSFSRLGARDLKTLAKRLHQALAGRTEPLSLDQCRDLVAQLHGHASWEAAHQGSTSQGARSSESKGLSFLGHTQVRSRWGGMKTQAIHLDPEDQRLNRILFGSTGSGLSETLLSMLYPAMEDGQGIILADARGDHGLALRASALARAVGREGDVRILNFLQGGRSTVAPEEPRYNPLERGSVAHIRSWLCPELLRSLDPAQVGPAQAVLDAVLNPLVAGRDAGHWPLDLKRLAKALQWESLQALLRDPRLAEDHRAGLRQALETLGGQTTALAYAPYEAALLRSLGISADQAVLESRLQGQVWHQADIDLGDVIENKRILIVLFPCMEKAPEAYASLSRLLARHWVAELQARKATLPPDYRAMWTFQDAEFFMSEALVEVATSGQDSGVMVLGSSMSYTDLKRWEAPAANAFLQLMGLKVFMKVHDPEVAPLLHRHADMGIRSEKETDDDLRMQGPGEAHVLWRTHLHRIRLAYQPSPRDPKGIPAVLSTQTRQVSGDIP